MLYLLCHTTWLGWFGVIDVLLHCYLCTYHRSGSISDASRSRVSGLYKRMAVRGSENKQDVCKRIMPPKAFFVTDVLYNWISQFKISCTNV